MKKFELWFPIKPWYVNQKFGENQNGLYKNLGMLGHNGLDLAATDGQIIRAAHEGEVVFTGEDGSGGLGVVIRSAEEFVYNGGSSYFKSIYWHCKKGSFKVKPGDKVMAGDPIAEADNTGLSTATHLHFGVKPVIKGEQSWEWMNLESDNGYKGAVNPELFFNGYFAEDQKFVIWTMKQIIELLRKVVVLLSFKK